MVLIGIAIGTTFWGQRLASQEPLNIYHPVTGELIDVLKNKDTSQRSKSSKSEALDPSRPPIYGVDDLPDKELSAVYIEAYVERHLHHFPECGAYADIFADAKSEVVSRRYKMAEKGEGTSRFIEKHEVQ